MAFESSCDETAAAVVEDGRIIRSDVILSQVDVHALYGGVVPEIASRKHVEAIAALADRALAEAGIAANVHYKPLPMMTAYRNLGFRIGDYPNAYRQYENEVTLPLNTRLDDDDVEYVIDEMRKTLSSL